MSLKNKKKILLSLLLVISLTFITFTLAKYTSSINKKLSLNITDQSSYTVVFHSNNGNDQTVSQTFVIGEEKKLTANSFTNSNLVFSYWNTEQNGSGTNYKDMQSVVNLSNENNAVVDLYAQWVNGIAEMNGSYYSTLKAAIEAVPKDGTETTVRLLKDTSDTITTNASQNIVLDLQTYTVSNKDSNKNVIKNYGTLKLISGTITSDASSGALDVESGATLLMTGGSIIATGTRQAIYNNKGTVTITGDAYLSAATSERGTVQNLASSTMYIKGGTIISTGLSGVVNAGTLTIGIKDGTVYNLPHIRGIEYGIDSTLTFSYYDGVIYGKTKAINNDIRISDVETNYSATHTRETIDAIEYDKLILDNSACTVTFNANGGSVSEPRRIVATGSQIGPLPTPKRTDYIFAGWWTERTGGTRIWGSTVINSTMTIYAHWTPRDTQVAQVGNTIYDSLQEAISATPNNSQQPTTVTLLKNINSAVTVSEHKNIILDMNNHTFSDTVYSAASITNMGTLTINNGSFTTATSYTNNSTINNELGTLNLNNVNITVTGQKQAIYITDGTVTIDGNSHITSETTGISRDSVLHRGTITCLTNGTLVVKGGTIEGTEQNAISSEGTVIIGEEDGTIDATTPIIIGKVNAINSIGTLSIYDGIFKGETAAINGTIDAIEQNTRWVDTNEIIGATTYLVKYLEVIT